MRINYNVSAMLSNNTLANNDDLLAKAIERLSSGLKINNAKDNPAGLAMAKRMDAQISGTKVARQNSDDGISVIDTADGALGEIQAMLLRMDELATQAANGTLTEDDNKVIQDEIVELKTEIDRIGKSTQFNSQNLFDGGFDYKAFSDNNDVKISTYSQDVLTGTYKISSLTWTVEDAASGKMSAQFVPGDGFPSTNPGDYQITMIDNYVHIKGINNFDMTLEINEDLVFDATEQPMAGSITSEFEIDCTGVGPMRLQVGANEGQTIPVEIPKISLGNMGLQHIDVSDHEKASFAIDRIQNATAFINKVRGKLGAYQNRLETTTSNLDVVSENMTAAYSRVMDVDMAEEMTEYSTLTVLTQAGTSILAQANERPSQVLQLLQ